MKRHPLLISCLLLASLLGSFVQAQDVTVTVTPQSASVRAIPVVTWSTTPAATACTATGGWSGAKASSGSQTLPEVTRTTTFGLTCTFAGTPAQPGTKVVSWVAPTTNTDGSPLTNLASFRVLYGTSASNLDRSAVVDSAAARSWTTPSLVHGTYFFAVRAVNSAGAESDNSSPLVQAVVGTPAGQASTASGSATLTIAPAPNPPTGVTVADMNATVYDLAVGSDGLSIVAGRSVGFMRARTNCGDQVSATNLALRVVPKSRVHFREWVPNHAPVVARCS